MAKEKKKATRKRVNNPNKIRHELRIDLSNDEKHIILFFEIFYTFRLVQGDFIGTDYLLENCTEFCIEEELTGLRPLTKEERMYYQKLLQDDILIVKWIIISLHAIEGLLQDEEQYMSDSLRQIGYHINELKNEKDTD